MTAAKTWPIVACLLWLGIATAPRAERPQPLAAGVLLYAMPGLPDPNFERTVVLLIEHNAQGSLGVVVNRPTDLGLETVLDLEENPLGLEVPVYWGGPVQPSAVMVLLRSARPGLRTRTVVRDVQLVQDLSEVRDMLSQRDARLRVRVFAGYAGWDKGQLADEMRRGSWVLDRADAATVFTPEPSRLWERVHEIRTRLQAWALEPPRPPRRLPGHHPVPAVPEVGVERKGAIKAELVD